MATVAIGKIGSIEGNVNVVHADGTTGSLQQGAIVYADDAITTGENSHTRIEFVDGSSLNIGPEFTATLGKDVFDPALIPESELVILDSSDRAVTPDSGHDTEGYGVRVGVVETTVGVVEAVDEDGAIRTLLAGDALYATDILKVSSDGDVSIRLVDGSELSLGPNSLARMDDVDPTGISQVAGLTEPAEIEAAIIAGSDPTREAAAPAAGESGGNEGGLPVILTRSDRAVTPDSGHETHGQVQPFTVIEQDLLAPEPVAGVVTDNAIGPDNTVAEAGLDLNGSDASADSETATGTFDLSATDGIKSVVIDGVVISFSELINFTAGNPGNPVDTGEGELTLTGYTGDAFSGTVDYSYTLKAPIDNDSKAGATEDYFDDSITVTVNGENGSTSSDDLVMRIIDDVPTAKDDEITIAEGTTTAISGEVLPNDTTGADTPASFDDWASTTASYGTFTDTGNGTYSYLLDNTDPRVVALDDNESLTETFDYTMRDADGDPSTATLTITINGSNGTPVIEVDPGNPDGANDQVDEAGLAAGSNPTADSEFAGGTFTLSDSDGRDDLESVTINGTTVTLGSLEGTSFTGSNGTLTVTDYDAATGVATYEYELTSPSADVAGIESDDFTLTAFDGTTNSAEATITIEIIDDVPTAKDDSNAIAEGTTTAISGEVLPNDTTGADTPASFDDWASTTASYGTFTDTGNGTYSYLLDNTDPRVVALDDNESLTETFDYTMRDADGDPSTATLTITINGSNGTPVIEVDPGNPDGANDQVDEAGLAAGSNPTADSEFAGGTFTLSDSDGRDDLESVTINGTTVTLGSLEGTSFTGSNGTLTVTDYDAVTGVATYTYELTSPSTDVAGIESDDFTLTAFDGTTNSAEATITIEIIDDVPTAKDDSNAIAEGTTTAISGEVLPNDTTGADTPASFDDWASTTASYGTFTDTGNGTYSYLLDNTDPRVVALDDNESLTETFDYTMRDADGDPSTATLTITINGSNGTPVIEVDPGNPDGANDQVDEAGLAAGSNPTADSEFAGGTFTLSDSDGRDDLESVTINGTTVTLGSLEGTSFTGSNGTLTVTDYDAATGVATYEYELTSPSADVAGIESDDFTLTAFDGTTNSAEATITIEIIDDVPTAKDDSNAIAEGTTTAISGEVLPNDTTGADTPASFDDWASTTASYGTFTDTGNGTYSYLLDNTDPRVVALDDNESLTETFDYTMRDADGDPSTATLTITINGSNGTPVIEVDPGNPDGANDQVDEAGLAAGSNPTADSEFAGGTFTLSDSDGRDDLESVTINGTTVTLGSLEGTSFTGSNGTLTVTDYDAATGVATYEYELTSPSTDVAGIESDDFTLTAFDGTTNSAEATITIEIIDDVPTAKDDSNAIAEGTTTAISGEVLPNDTTGADTPASFDDWASTTASYGTFTDTGNGTYSYLLDNTDPRVVALDDNESLTETFDYTMRDADGDPSTATLTITINGSNGTPVIEVDPGNPDGANDQVDEAGLAAGSNPTADSEFAGGTFTLSDSDGRDDLESVTINGTTVTLGSLEGTSFTGSNGTLTVTDYDATTGVATYTYELTSPSADVAGIESDDFTLTAFDGTTNSAEATITIEIIDDVPTAKDDSNAIAEGTTTAISGEVLPNDTTGADTPASFDDWASTTASYGTFTDTGNGTYSYLLDNTDPRVVALDDNESLTETFDYTMRDADGDPSTATLTITINGSNGTPVIEVDPGNPDGANDQVDEAGLAAGSNPTADSEFAGGTFTLSDSDGRDDLESVTINGTTVTLGSLEGTSFTGSNGTLTVTDYDAATGVATYEYELTSPSTDVAGIESDDFTLTAFDGTTNSAEATITIEIIDDVPTAKDDSNAIAEGTTTAISGEVLPNDTTGADTPASFDDWASTTASYGTFTDTGNGTYSYLLDNTDPRVVALDDNESLTETFDYTMRDADGDPSTATLTITINGSNGTPVIEVDPGNPDGANDQVDEAGLAAGSNPTADSEFAGGTFTLSDSDGRDDLESVTINGTTVTLGSLEGTSFTGSNGTLTVTDYDAATGVATYEYELTSPSTDVAGIESDDFTLTASDGTTNSAEATISIDIIDDVPIAVVNASGVSVTHDETSGDDSDADDVVPAPTSITSVYGTSSVIGGANSGSVAITTSGSAYGADGAGTTLVTLSDASGGVINAVNSGLNVSGDTTASGDIYLFTDSNGFITGHVGSAVDGYGNPTGSLVFVLALESDNSISVVQYEAIEDTYDGSSAAAHDHTESITNLIYATVAVTDGDGDTVTQTSSNAITVNFEDDGPEAFTAMSAIVVNSGDAVGSGLLNFLANSGADGLGSVVFSGTNGTILSGTVGGVTSNITALGGENIALTGFGTTTLTATSTTSNTVVFTVTLDPANDTYTIDYDFPLDDGSGITFDDFSGVSGGQNQWVAFDGDSGDIDYDNNDSKDLLVTAEPGGTVNTNSTDIGSANNHIDPNQYIRLDLVTDVTRQPGMNETDLGGYQYDDHYQADNFAFTLFQSNKDNVVKFTVFNFDDTATDQADLSGNSIALDIIDVSSIVVTDNQNNILVLGVDYDVYKEGDSVYISGLFGGNGAHPGDTVSFGVIAGTSFEALQIDNADGDTINDELTGTTVNLAGENFSIGGFEFGTAEAGQEVDFSLDLTATDGDGDTTTGTLDILLSPDGNTATAPDSAGYALIGDSSSDILVGAGGDDILTGGHGDDIISGGAGADTFTWLAGESGTDVVNDFSTEEGDVLNIADLLVGEESLDHSIDELLAAALDSDYISIATGTDTTVTIFSDGEGSGTPGDDQVIQLNGYDTTSFANSADVINSLLDNGSLLTD